MREADELTGFADFVIRRIDRAELFERLPEGWMQGERGGPSWSAPGDYVREDAPRAFTRPTVVAGVKGIVRLHYAKGDPGLRRVTIVLDPLATNSTGAGASVHDLFNAVADLLRRDGELPCVISGSLHPHDDGVQFVIDIAALVFSGPDEPPSMEEFFVYYD